MEITAGNIGLDDAHRLQHASPYPNPDWRPGDTEPWIIQAVASLLLASGHQTVIELGGYSGACSRVLAETLTKLGGGYLVVMEHEGEQVTEIQRALAPYENVDWEVWYTDVLDGIDRLKDQSVGFAWVDDTHEGPHVVEEVHRLIPKMRDTGLILFHDVCGAYALHHVVRHYGGIALNLPRVSHSGGLGILQVTPSTRLIRKMQPRWEDPPLVLQTGTTLHQVMGAEQEPG